jgi:hypothetical protein
LGELSAVDRGDDQPQQAVKARNMIKNGTPDMEGGTWRGLHA